MEYFIKKFSECPRVDVKAGTVSEAIEKMERREPGQGKKLERLLGNPDLLSYRLITPSQTEGRFAVHYVEFPEGQDFPPHHHDDVYALLYIARGHGHAVMNGTRHAIAEGDVIFVPPGTWHEIVAEGGPLAYIACISPDLGQDGRADFRFT